MTANAIRVGIIGAAGRMGQRLMQVIAQTEQMKLGAVLLHKRPIALAPGTQAVVTDDRQTFVRAVDIVIDFSAPAAVDQIVPLCVQEKVPYLVASTALSAPQQKAVDVAAKQLPILVAANLSVGVAVLGQLIADAAKRLRDFDIEIVETHHRHKRDAPSGTALYLYEQLRAARSELQAEAGRAGGDLQRRTSEVGLHAVRGGDVAVEHQVLFLGDSERIELTHKSHDGQVFARGAVRAATWLVSQPPGLYSMHHVLEGHHKEPSA